MQFSPVLLVLAAAAAVIASPAPLGELNKRTPEPLASPDHEGTAWGGPGGPDWKRDHEGTAGGAPDWKRDHEGTAGSAPDWKRDHEGTAWGGPGGPDWKRD